MWLVKLYDAGILSAPIMKNTAVQKMRWIKRRSSTTNTFPRLVRITSGLRGEKRRRKTTIGRQWTRRVNAGDSNPAGPPARPLPRWESQEFEPAARAARPPAGRRGGREEWRRAAPVSERDPPRRRTGVREGKEKGKGKRSGRKRSTGAARRRRGARGGGGGDGGGRGARRGVRVRLLFVCLCPPACACP